MKRVKWYATLFVLQTGIQIHTFIHLVRMMMKAKHKRYVSRELLMPCASEDAENLLQPFYEPLN
jgi:hypothetical protein